MTPTFKVERREGLWLSISLYTLLKKVPGETPAKCIKTWNPIPHGRTDYIFCLWEAEKPEDIEASLGDFLNYLTVDNLQVDEIDWEEAAKAGG